MNKPFIIIISVATLILAVLIVVVGIFNRQTTESPQDGQLTAPTSVPNRFSGSNRSSGMPRSLEQSGLVAPISSLSADQRNLFQDVASTLPYSSEALDIEYSALTNKIYVGKKNENADAELSDYLSQRGLLDFFRSNPEFFVIAPSPISDFMMGREQETMSQILIHEEDEVTPTLSYSQQRTEERTATFNQVFRGIFSMKIPSQPTSAPRTSFRTATSSPIVTSVVTNTNTPTNPKSGAGSTTSVPVNPISGLPSGPVPSSEVVRVQGYLVHKSVADKFDAMLTAAKAAGIRLGNNGAWASYEFQVSKFRRWCPNTPLDQKCDGAARPGRSRHEFGIAIDFLCDGKGIPQRVNPGQNSCYDWLVVNAGKYGFYEWGKGLNRSAGGYEAWHWSADGK